MKTSRVAVALALALVACKKGEKAEPKVDKPAADAGQAAPIADAAPIAAATPDAAPAPKFPPLGAPPAGLDAALATACDAGDGKACLAAARAYEPRGAFRVNMTKEEGDLHVLWTGRYAERACEIGAGEGCALAEYFVENHPDKEHGPKLLTRGCELGDPWACGRIGGQLIRAEATRARGLELMAQGCRANAVGHVDDPHGTLCAELAELYAGEGSGEVAKDAALQKQFHELACQQGQKLGCPCTEATVDKDCGVADEYDRWYCSDEGLCDLSAPG